MPSDLEFSSGAIFATDFRIERPLSQGGMGAVYVAHQLSTGRDRALKLMHKNLLRDDDMRRRFEQEAKIGSRIKSDHVVQVIAAGIDAESGVPWLAMELLEGENLADYLLSRGSLSLVEACAILAQTCHALAAAHAAAVVHRDLKPENIFVSRAQRAGAPLVVKLLDLGIAKLVAESHPGETAAIGTPLWMAPEQAGGRVSVQTDVWALGLIAFWMLTERFYWRTANAAPGGASMLAVLKELAADPLEPASVRARSLGVERPLPAGFDAWFARCVNRTLSERYRDAGEAYGALARLAEGQADTVQIPSQQQLQPARSADSAARAAVTQTALERAPTKKVSARRVLAWTLLGLTLAGGVALGYRSESRGAASSPSASANPTASALARPSPSALASAAPASSVTDNGEAFDPKDLSTVWRMPLGDSPRRGPDDALVTIVEFANFQCPVSKGAEDTIRKILAEHPDTVRLVWKDDPLAVHFHAEGAANVAREARAQRGEAGFWAIHDLFMKSDFRPTPMRLRDAGKELGLHPGSVEKVLAEHLHSDQITADADLADQFGTLGTPYYFVNGRRVPATPALRASVEDELGRVQAELAAGAPRAGSYERITGKGRGPLPLELKSYQVGTSSAPTRGSEKGEALLIEFCDYRNFLCHLIDPTITDLLAAFPSLTMTWIDVPPASSDDSRRAALASRAAYRQKGVEGYNAMHKLLLDAPPGGYSSATLDGFALAAGFARDEFHESIRDPELAGDVERDAQGARASGIGGELPAFLVCGADYCARGGYYLTGGQPRRSFEKRIRLALDAKGKSLVERP
ncbi:MAG TPA: protein kinase [Polyangiaceae bacterium]